jgi:hypothetical protein
MDESYKYFVTPTTKKVSQKSTVEAAGWQLGLI